MTQSLRRARHRAVHTVVLSVLALAGCGGRSANAQAPASQATVAVFRGDGTFTIATVQGPLSGTYVTGDGESVILTESLRYHIGNHGHVLDLRDANTGALVMSAVAAPETLAIFRRDGTFVLATVQGPLYGEYVMVNGQSVALTSRLRYHIDGSNLVLRDARTGEIVIAAGAVK